MDKWFKRVCVGCDLPLIKLHGFIEALTCGHMLCCSCVSLLILKSEYIMCPLCLSISPRNSYSSPSTEEPALMNFKQEPLLSDSNKKSFMPEITEMLLNCSISTKADKNEQQPAIFTEAQLAEALQNLNVSDNKTQPRILDDFQ